MRIFLSIPDEARRDCTLPHEGADHAIASGACPKCKAEPFKVQGSGRHASGDDRAWEATAGCVACRQVVGTLRAEMNTLFGVREDEAVLRGRCRVY